MMAHSFKKHPAGSTYDSTKQLKKIRNRAFRRKEKQSINKGEDPPPLKQFINERDYDSENMYDPTLCFKDHPERFRK